jgi:hypothetical protein
MGLAAFSIGTTYLGFGAPSVTDPVQRLTSDAVWGRTDELDEADRWFRNAVEISEQLRPDARLMDQRISTPLRLQAFARSCLALTALIRYSAAAQADQLDAAMAWLQVAGEEAQRALLSDPDNDPARQILKSVIPLRHD